MQPHSPSVWDCTTLSTEDHLHASLPHHQSDESRPIRGDEQRVAARSSLSLVKALVVLG